nr:MAG TPA: hypothetical protein [Caudoviricetes sp.]
MGSNLICNITYHKTFDCIIVSPLKVSPKFKCYPSINRVALG